MGSALGNPSHGSALSHPGPHPDEIGRECIRESRMRTHRRNSLTGALPPVGGGEIPPNLGFLMGVSSRPAVGEIDTTWLLDESPGEGRSEA